MDPIYLLIYGVIYGVPLIGSYVLALILVKTVFKGRSWRWPVSFGFVLAASCMPWLLDRISISRDVAAYGPDIISPETLTLEAGALWRLEDSNHAGITCGYFCNYDALPFVTEVSGSESPAYGLQFHNTGHQLGQHNLWDGLYGRTPTEGEPFPYQYAYISLLSYQDYGVPQSGNYRKPHWPEDGKGVHLLVRLPENGQIDFGNADVLYRRYNIQTEAALPFLWGIARGTVQIPSSVTIFQDLVAISSVQ